MQKEGWIIIGAAFLLLVCVISSVALGAVSGDAVRSALAGEEATASSALRSTNVCIGIFNLGACRSQQTSTTTTTKAPTPPASPWEIILVLSIACVAGVAGSLALFAADN